METYELKKNIEDSTKKAKDLWRLLWHRSKKGKNKRIRKYNARG